MPYRRVIVSSGKPARKAGKGVWEVDIYVRGLPRYQKRHYGTRTEIAREEVKIHEQMLAQVGKVPGVLKDLLFLNSSIGILNMSGHYRKVGRRL